jgi:hypothetical protein
MLLLLLYRGRSNSAFRMIRSPLSMSVIASSLMLGNHECLANLYNQRVERVRNSCMSLKVEPPSVQSTGELRRNPHIIVVSVEIDAQHEKTLRLHL